MGGASSKVARKLPTKQRPSWAGARADSMPPPSQAARAALKASETRTEAIEKDARDPQFMANLSRLGQVKVDHHMTTFQTDTRMRNLLHKQQASEEEASSSTNRRNHLLAGSLAELLDERKFVQSAQELKVLAERYNVDVDVLERVAKSVNTPSVLPGSERRVLSENGDERTMVMTTWVDRDPSVRTNS